MRDVRVQYFLSYGVLGTVLPFASVYFRAAGFSEAQVGYAWAAYSAAVVCSPVLVTLAADTRADPRRLMLAGLLVSGLALVALGFIHGAASILAVWSVFCLTYLPLLPLQDGIAFSLQQRRLERNERPMPFHRVRLWGTIGYLVPSVVLFLLLRAGWRAAAAVTSGALFAAVAAVQAILLDDPRAHGAARNVNGERTTLASRLPTLGAARALFRPDMRAFCAAIFLSQTASMIYMSFYPIYLTERAGFAPRWVGLISSIGVVVEAFFLAACGWLTARLGVRRLLLLGLALVTVRLLLLAASAHPAVAVGTQLFHGIMVAALSIVPQTFVNARATDRDRHSMQGVFVMLLGAARVAGSLAGGRAAAHGLAAPFALGALLCAAAAAVVLAFFREPEAREADEPAVSPVAAGVAAEQ